MNISEILKTRTIIHSSITLMGTVITGVLGILFYILVARFLGPDEFGILMISIALITMLADIANLGTDSGLIRFVGKHYQHDFNKSLQFMKLGLKVKLFVGIVIVVMGWLLVPFISDYFFQKQELILPLRLSLFGVFGALLFSFVTHSIQAIQKFAVWSFINIIMNGLRLFVILVLISQSHLALDSVLVTYIIMPFLGFLIGMLFLPEFLLIKNENTIAKEFFHYNRWIAIFTIMAALSSRLDIFITGRLLSLEQVGIYSAASQVTSVVPQMIFALATVVAPKLASFNSDIDAKKYLKKLQLFVIGLSFAGILLIPVGAYLLPLFFGSAYQQSVTPFIILFVAQLIFLISLPAHQAVFYYFAYPKLFVWVALGNLLIISIVGWILIFTYGIIGAAVTVLIGNIFNFLVPGVWVLMKFSKKV